MTACVFICNPLFSSVVTYELTALKCGFLDTQSVETSAITVTCVYIPNCNSWWCSLLLIPHTACLIKFFLVNYRMVYGFGNVESTKIKRQFWCSWPSQTFRTNNIILKQYPTALLNGCRTKRSDTILLTFRFVFKNQLRAVIPVGNRNSARFYTCMHLYRCTCY